MAICLGVCRLVEGCWSILSSKPIPYVAGICWYRCCMMPDRVQCQWKHKVAGHRKPLVEGILQSQDLHMKAVSGHQMFALLSQRILRKPLAASRKRVFHPCVILLRL